MADLGSIGVSNGEGVSCSQLQQIVIDSGSQRPMSIGVVRENSEGNPTPCLKFEQAGGKFRFRWAVAAGTRTISIGVKQAANAAPFPTLRVLAKPEIGIPVDVVGTAGAGAGWKTIGPVTVVPTVKGAVWVELENLYNGAIPPSPCYWDNVAAT